MDRYCDVIIYKNIWIRASTRIRGHIVYINSHSGERIQKSSCIRIKTFDDYKISGGTAETPSVYSGDTERILRTSVDASCIRIKTFADTKSPDSCGRALIVSLFLSEECNVLLVGDC